MLQGMKINKEQQNQYYANGFWSTETVHDMFSKSVKKFPNNTAVVDKRRRVTYEQLHDYVLRFSAGLQKLGIRKGDFISVQLPNCVEYVITYLACARIGAIFNPIPTNIGESDIKYMLELCESKLYIVPNKHHRTDFIQLASSITNQLDIPYVMIVNYEDDQLKIESPLLSFEDVCDIKVDYNENFNYGVSADSPLIVLFTSGTESRPKGVIHSHNTVLFGEKQMQETLLVTENDAVFMASPLSHATGFLHGVNLPLITGAKSVLMDRFSAENALKLMVKEKCTFTMGATPFLHDMLEILLEDKRSYDLSAFRFFLCGGAPIPRHLVSQATEIGFKVLAVYGSTESPPHTVSRLSDSDEMIVSYDGKPLPGIEVKVVDDDRSTLVIEEVGEQASRGPNVFLGYFKQPELTNSYLDDDGWYYSGDLCKLFDNDYIRIVGRKKDIIIRGGQNISPVEIEDILYKHPSIQDVALVSVEDERMGERSCAFVTLKANKTFEFEQMIEFLEEQQIAKYKYPEQLEIMDKLPMTSSGKVQKYQLSELYKEKYQTT